MQTELLQSAANGAEIARYRPAVEPNLLLPGGLAFYLLFFFNPGPKQSGRTLFLKASCAHKRFTYPTDSALLAVPNTPNRFQFIVVTLRVRMRHRRLFHDISNHSVFRSPFQSKRKNPLVKQLWCDSYPSLFPLTTLPNTSLPQPFQVPYLYC